MRFPIVLLSLLALVQGEQFPLEEYLLFEPHVEAEPPPLVSVPELMTKLGLNTAVQLIKESNLCPLLQSSPPGKEFTVFAPSEAAIQKLPTGVRDQLMKNKTFLMDTLTFHIVQGKEKLFLKDFGNDYIYTTLFGLDLRVNIYNVSEPGKGVKTLYTATGVPISRPDNVASNGIVHVIDDVMFPTVMTSTDVITMLSDLSRIAQLFNQSGILYPYLNGEIGTTVFAPVNEAFEALPPDVQNKLKSNETYLYLVIINHLVGGSFFVPGLYNGERLHIIPPFNGTLTVTTSKDKIMVDDAEITAGFKTSGGIVYRVNKVLLPKDL